jgi:hypothetical protein
MLSEIGVKIILDGMVEFIRSTSAVNAALLDMQRNASQAALSMNALGSANVAPVATAVKNVGNESTDAKGKVAGVADAVRDVKDAGEDMAKSATQGGGWMEGVGIMAGGAYARLGEMVVEKLTAVFNNIKDFIMEAPQVAGDFQASMLKFEAAAGIKDPEMGADMKAYFLELGALMPVTVQEVTAAATELAKAGLDTETITGGMLESLIKFSLAADMDVPKAAETASKFLGTFGERSWDAGQKVEFVNSTLELLQKGANTSVLDADGFSEALLGSAGAAKTAGVSLDDYAMAMAATSAGFNSAAEQGTSMREFLQRLNPTMMKSRDVMRGLGLITTDATKLQEAFSLYGLQPVSNDIGEMEQQMIEYLRTEQKFTNTDVTKFLDSVGTNAFYANGKLKNMTEIAGLLSTAFEGMTDEERGQAMRTMFEITGMNAAVQVMKLGSDGMTEYKNDMTDAMGVTEMYDKTFQGLNASQENLEGSMASFQIQIGDLFLPGMQVWEDFQNDLVVGASQILSVLTGNFDWLSMSSLSPTMQSIILFTQNAKQAFSEWLTTLDPVVAVFMQFGDYLMTAFLPIWDALQPMLEDISQHFENTFGSSGDTGIGEIVTVALKLIADVIVGTLKVILQVVAWALWLIIGIWAVFGDAIMALVRPVWDFLVAGFLTFGDAIGAVFAAIGALFAGEWRLALQILVDFGKSAIDRIATMWASLGILIPGVLAELIQDIGTPLMNIGVTIAYWLAVAIESVYNWIADLTGAFDKIDLATSAKLMMIGFIAEFKKWTVKMIDDVALFGNKILETFKNIFKFGSPSKVMKQYGNWLGEGLSIGITQSVPAVAQATNSMVRAIDRPMTTIDNTISSANNYYNLGITTTASPTTIIRSYDLMRATL